MSATADNTERVLKKIAEIVGRSADGDYIFRGEPKYYGKVSSNLYRQYSDVEAEQFNIEVVQKEILQEAKRHTDERDDFEILTQLQHHGGKTNLIDFTTDFHIALFFACDSHPEKDGRVILKQRESVKDHLWEPHHPKNRVLSQKSMFVRPPQGFIETDDVVPIPQDLKQPILSYLRKYHSISTASIYNDLHGFITTQRIHESAYTEFFRGLTCSGKRDSDEAICHYTKAVELNPNLAAAYYNRGNIYRDKGEFDLAIADFAKAIELDPNDAESYTNRGAVYGRKGDLDWTVRDCTKAIELDCTHVFAHINRGIAYIQKGKFDLAIADFTKVIELDPNYDSAYYYRGVAWLIGEKWDKAKSDLRVAEDKKLDISVAFGRQHQSIADFEKRFGVELPEDIKAMLIPQ